MYIASNNNHNNNNNSKNNSINNNNKLFLVNFFFTSLRLNSIDGLWCECNMYVCTKDRWARKICNSQLFLYQPPMLRSLLKVATNLEQGVVCSYHRESVKGIQAWMTRVRFKLNDDKAEFLVIFSPSYDVSQLTFKAGNNTIKRSQSCRNLGVIFYSKLNMKLHISKVFKTSFFHLRNISALRKYITTDSCEKLVHSFVTSKLDYCNLLTSHFGRFTKRELQ